MNLVIRECVKDRSLFHDLSVNLTIDRWIQSMLAFSTSFRPLDCTVYGRDGNRYPILRSGEANADAVTGMEQELKALPDSHQWIPNDYLEIEADLFERELVIYLYPQEL